MGDGPEKEEVGMNGRTWMIQGAAGVCVLVWGLATVQARPEAAGQSAAVVNGEAISMADLEAALKQAGPTPTQLTEAQRKQYQIQALYFLIDQALMRQFLAKNARPADTDEVNKKLVEMAGALKKQGKTWEDLCRDTHQTPAQVRAGIAQHIQWYTYAREHIGDTELEQYYKEYKDLFDRTSVRISDIFVPLPGTATDGEKAAARARLTDLRGEIVDGKVDFAATAKTQSRGPTAEMGGDLGFIPRKWAVEEAVARVAFAMTPGQVSDVIETEYGLHLIKLTERKPGVASDLAKIKDDVRDVMIEDLYFNVLSQQRKAAKIEIHLP
jgi:peptidyl-prolyl cis-trans isomerase C